MDGWMDRWMEGLKDGWRQQTLVIFNGRQVYIYIYIYIYSEFVGVISKH